MAYEFDSNERINSYVFNFNERIRKDDSNIGITYTYLNIELGESKIKTESPIFYEDIIRRIIIKYYCGETSNGKYDDNTGKAFYISYENDKARLFYQGCFDKGVFRDERSVAPDSKTQDNSAFMIVLSEDESRYFYYIGSFSNGQPTEENWKNNPESYEIANPSNKLPQRHDLPDFEWKPIRSAVSSI